MATPTVGGSIWLVTFRYALDGQALLNTFVYQQSSLPTADYAAYAANIAVAMQAPGGLQDSIVNAITTDCLLSEIVLQPIRPTRLQAIHVTVGINGTRPGLAAPPNVAQSIERRGVTANKHNIGRIQLPPCAAADITGGTFTLIQAVNLKAVADNLLLSFSSGVPAVTLNPVLISKNTAIVPSPITSSQVRLTSRVMRRRTVGVGI